MSITPAATAANRKCMGKKATIVGTNGADTLSGTRRVDVIVGRGGADTIHGKGGADLICSGGGNDTVYAGAGADRVRGGSGGDSIVAGTKANLLAPGADLLEGNDGSDVLIGGPEDDWMRGGAGVDALLGLGADDHYAGGSEIDIAAFLVAQGAVTVDLFNGSAIGEGEDSLSGIEAVIGSSYDDVIRGDSRTNFLWGLGGGDVLDGRAGDDFVLYSLAEASVTVNLADGIGVGEGTDSLVAVEHVVGSNADDTLIGDPGDNYLDGAGGVDDVDGRGGLDLCIAETTRNCPQPVNLGTGSEGDEPGGTSSSRVRLSPLLDEPPPPPAEAQPVDSVRASSDSVRASSDSVRASSLANVTSSPFYVGALYSGFGPSNEGEGGCYSQLAQAPGYGRLATAARWQNGNTWSQWRYWNWTYVANDGITVRRWEYRDGVGWVEIAYDAVQFVPSAPGTVIAAQWRNHNGYWAEQSPGYCPVSSGGNWVLNVGSLGSALFIPMGG